MRIIDTEGNPLQSPNLNKGYLVVRQEIRENATPIDNITKFAWEDDDYEEVQVYIPHEEQTAEPTQLDRIEAQVAYTAMMTGTLMEGVT